MCGIAGVFGFEAWGQGGEAAALAAVDRMNAAQAHRGPDAGGVWSDGTEVVLGHRRLGIIDPGEAANQPWLDPVTGDALVFNGEVYNYRELKPELSGGFAFRTDSDTEVVLAALQQWGWGALDRFNGMFAIAYWKAATRELWLIRDRLGVKPLYWAQSKGSVLFSSEVRGLLASGVVSRKHDPAGLVDYMRYQTVHAPRTLLADVKMLMPGHAMRLQDAEMEEWAWWDLGRSAGEQLAATGVLGAAEAQRRVRSALRDAVYLRMRADVPLGAFLSGGIDSSAVVGLMREVTDRPIATFSVTFQEGDWDESRWSRMVAGKFDTDHHEIRLTPAAFLERIPAALAAMDHPSGDGPNTFIVSEETKAQGITVALSGLGGDEVFAGYPVFERSRDLMSYRWLAGWPKGLRKAAGSLYSSWKGDVSARKKAALLAGDYFDLEHTYPFSRQMYLESDLRRIYPSAHQHPNAVFQWLKHAIAPDQPGFGLPFLSKVSWAEMHTYMAHTLLRDADQMSMAHALEVRVPFLDYRLVTQVAAMQDAVKWRAGRQKPLLVDALGDLLPRELVERPKMGFVLPWDQWMRESLRPVCEAGIAGLKRIPGLHHAEVEGLWQRFLRGDAGVNHARLWMWVVLGDWMDRHGIE